MVRRTQTGTLVSLLALACAAMAIAGVRPRVESVPCTPGGVAAVPIERTPGTPWPARVPVRIGGLQSLATVIWIGAAADDGGRSWARSPERIDAMLVAEMPPMPEPETVGEVFAVFDLPAAGEGSIEIDGTAVAVRWLPAPQRVRADAPVLSVPAVPSDDRPDPGTPMEYWRWSLVAQRQGARIGDPRGDAADRLWARYLESIWAGSLERVRLTSQGIHAELCELLTGTSEDLDAGRTVASWIARPAELRALLSIIADMDRADMDAAQAALSWMRGRWTCTLWVEEDAGDRVRVAVANPTGGERVLRVNWVVTAGTSQPSALVAVPRRITRAWIERPAIQPSADAFANERTRSEVIEFTDGDARTRVAIGAREYPVNPPGLYFGSFVPPLSLADAQSASIAPPESAWRTSASLRRRGGHWELFIEAFRPAEAAEPQSDEVFLRIGDPLDPTHVLRVAADGTLEMRSGPDDGVAAGFMAWSDRWRARIELPEPWLPPAGPSSRPFLLSLERNPGPPHARQTAGLARPAWLKASAPVLVDLGLWDDFGH